MYSIYEIIGPTGKKYIGFTKERVTVRFGQHMRRAERRKTPHPFYDSIKKYGREAFSVRCVCSVEREEEARAMERRIISEEKPEYNVSPGGEDGKAGILRLAELRNDPVFDSEYKKALSDGCRKSEAHRESWGRIKSDNKEFREKNPREAYRIQRRATRCARRVCAGKPSWNAGISGKFKHSEESLEKMRERKQEVLSRRSYREKLRLGAKRMWENMSPEEKERRIAKMSASLKKRNAERRADAC